MVGITGVVTVLNTHNTHMHTIHTHNTHTHTIHTHTTHTDHSLHSLSHVPTVDEPVQVPRADVAETRTVAVCPSLLPLHPITQHIYRRIAKGVCVSLRVLV